MNSNLIEIIKYYIHTIEQRKDINELMEFYHPNIEQVEYPKLLAKNKTIRKLSDLKESYERSKKILQKERIRTVKLFTDKNTVIIKGE